MNTTASIERPGEVAAPKRTRGLLVENGGGDGAVRTMVSTTERNGDG